MLSEGRYDLVAPAAPQGAVLVLHPHPDMGGDRRNPVVDAVFRAAVDAGWAAARFDFSSGDPRVAGVEAAAALDLLPPATTTAVIGYSFGAGIAAGMLDARIDAWVLIAPPFGRLLPAADLPVGSDPRPKLLLTPAHDQFCPPASAAAETAGWQVAYHESVAGADHLLTGATAGVAARALQFVTS